MSENESHTLADDLAKSGYKMSEALEEALGSSQKDEAPESSVHTFGSMKEPEGKKDADEDPTQTDFFRAMNAYRAARKSGDEQAMREAEEHLRSVVHSELTESEGCGC